MLRRAFSRLEILSLADWKTHVLDSKVPVLAHFVADWSEKSEKLKAQLDGHSANTHWNIAEINADSLPLLTKAIDIQTIPTIYLIHKGQSLSCYKGEIKEKVFKSLIHKIKLLSGEWSEEELTQNLINEAYNFLIKKNCDEAIELYTEAHNILQTKEKYELTCWVGLAKAHFTREDYESAEFFIDKIRRKYSSTLSKNKEIQDLLAGLMKIIGDKREGNKYKEYYEVIKGLNHDVFEDPYNNEKHAKIAIAHYHYGFIEEGIKKALQIIDSEGSLTGNGYKVLMEIVNDLGNDNQYVKDLQPKLQMIHRKYRS
ncbi:hypothetical protein SteCoe_26584 [Stentor coeruleus]|uniref:Thioredoxin domain-containing protein n=1 Tax=Stentor coeruleus TaxID=5963 RepID=A0A1R2BCH8_9CILI|nr:hypothetical protein SteCoe_26584 [Stentor coeruleus]